MVILFPLLSTGLLFAALITLSVIDARHLILPDTITLPLILAGLVIAPLMGAPFWLHGLGGLTGYGSLVLIEKTYRCVRGRPGLGRGAAKLFAAGGTWFGAIALPAILLVSSLAALVYALVLKHAFGREVTADCMLAFGPFLAFGIALAWSLQRLGLSGPMGF